MARSSRRPLDDCFVSPAGGYHVPVSPAHPINTARILLPIDEVVERRPEWSDKYPYHYDLRLAVDATPVYVETRLHFRLPVVPDDSWIEVVNIHAP